MKNNRIFLGMVFIGAGIYYLTSEFAPTVADQWLTWETLLIWLGLALSIDGFFMNASSALLPGIFMIGLGIHYHAFAIYPEWPAHIGSLAGFLGIACLVTYLRTKKDVLIIGIVLVCVSGLFLFFEPVVDRIAETSASFSFIWPLILLAIGLLLLFRRKKKRKGTFRRR